jgi:uncharacterized protein (DUF952 family)
MIIFHITKRNQWEEAKASGVYRTGNLANQGFIHCSTGEQIISVANGLFHGQSDLVLLSIETEKVRSRIQYENLEGGTNLFPHIYGPLNVDAVVTTVDFKPQPDGSFKLPE